MLIDLTIGETSWWIGDVGSKPQVYENIDTGEVNEHLGDKDVVDYGR